MLMCRLCNFQLIEGAGTVIVTSLFILGILAIIFLPGIQAANRLNNQRFAMSTLRILASEQESYRTENTIYATIENLAHTNKNDLMPSKKGYIFVDLIKTPNADFFAVLASPSKWGKDGDSHFIITSEGIAREWRKKELPFDLSLPATQNSVNLINKLNKAH